MEPNKREELAAPLLEEEEAKRVRQRQRAAFAIISQGFYSSTTASLITDVSQYQEFKAKAEELKAFIEEKRVDEELSPALTENLLDNIMILGRIQKEALGGADRRDAFLCSEEDVNWDDLPSWEEATRYSKYAIAAYGDKVIIATDLEINGKMDMRVGVSTKTRVSEHIGIPEKDLVLVNLDYTGEAGYLRHFVAVDHKHKKVVLAIRGTFNVAEIVTDASGFSRPFCGGESHSDICIMSEKLWERVGETVVEQLNKHPEYELILTGHSLGGGASNCVNVLLHQDNRRRVNGRKIRCFAYASPPVFTRLDIPEAVESAVNYIHEMDDVPFLSGYTVRHMGMVLAALEQQTKDLDVSTRKKLATGVEKPSESLKNEMLRLLAEPPPVKEGLPLMALPVKANVWICKEAGREVYDAKLCDSMKLAPGPIYLDPDRLLHHVPSRYEYCFRKLDVYNSEEPESSDHVRFFLCCCSDACWDCMSFPFRGWTSRTS